ncbi:hypothetical protein CPAR01_12146 [Colletotrichum paranaense]|uniref:Uncharacterized protein n=1 Tax=Colletotrichum paranaense TaxID=1914294 RepID=A0ABQ9S953_9PEZI|nr:uncharacterized protein CPAR01_12146 [Colletotrichum paranaense]KAK1529834.1 hypothetical protein CPAR01_12146 [Colletotrichum paranaense]
MHFLVLSGNSEVQVAEDVGNSDAPTVAQLRRCTSATHRQPRDGIRAQSSCSSPPHAPTRSAPAHRTPHRKATSSQSVSAARGKKRLSRFFALVSDPVQTPSRPNLLQSSPQSRRVRAHLVTSEALSQDDPSSARPGCLRCLSKFLFSFLMLVWAAGRHLRGHLGRGPDSRTRITANVVNPLQSVVTLFFFLPFSWPTLGKSLPSFCRDLYPLPLSHLSFPSFASSLALRLL